MHYFRADRYNVVFARRELDAGRPVYQRRCPVLPSRTPSMSGEQRGRKRWFPDVLAADPAVPWDRILKGPDKESDMFIRVVECQAKSAEQAGGTVLRGFKFMVQRGRKRFAPVEIGTRKPPVATWQANGSWEASAGSDADTGKRAEKRA